MRVTGLASGLDIDSMIEKVMAAERIPMDKLEQQKSIAEWKRDEYRELNKMLSEFDTYLFDFMSLSSKLSSKKASSSNDNAVSVTAGSGASNVNTEITVQKLATASRWQMTVADKSNQFPLKTGTDESTESFTIGFQVKNPGEDTYKTVNVTLSGNDSYETIAKKINNAKVGMTAFYDEKSGQFALTANNTGEGIDVRVNTEGLETLGKIGFSGLTTSADWTSQEVTVSTTKTATSLFNFPEDQEAITIKIGSETLEIKKTDTYKDIADKMKDANLGTFEDGKFKFDATKINLSGLTADERKEAEKFIQAFGGIAGNSFAPSVDGENAEFTYNGISLERESNTFDINGLNITLKAPTGTGEIVRLSTEADTEAIVKVVEDFVENYNTIVDRFNQEYSEKKYRDFAPLTEAQKKEMSEDQIKLWEAKAKSGMLRGDNILSSALSSMRNVLNFSKELQDIGISPSTNYLDKGKITLDKDKLRTAITENPDVVYDTFKGGGITDALRKEVKNTVKSIEEKAGNSLKTNDQFVLGKELDQIAKRMDLMEERLSAIETRYYRQFAAMEQAISNSNSQSAYIMQMFGQ